MPAFLTHKQWLAVLLAVFMAVALSACGGGGGGTTMPPDPGPTEPPMPTAYEQAMEAIAEAETAEAAQAAYDAVKDQVTAAQGEMLQAAVDARADALAMMAREAEQKQALMDAAGMIDTSDLSTQALVDAARTAIAGLRQAIANAADVSEADKAMYMMQLDNAVDAVDMAQGGIDTATRRMNQMTALSGASTTLQAALAALSGATPTQALLNAANNALDDLNAAIMDGADLTETEKAPYQHEADNAAMPIRMAQNTFDKDEADKAAANAAAMAATAMRLYDGISAPTGDVTSPAATDRAAAYNAANTAVVVSAGLPADSPAAVTLSEDKDKMVATHRGWQGMMLKAEPDGEAGTYEAVVYSHVGEPTEGAKFNAEYTDLDATTGERPIDTSTAAVQELVASPSFDQSAGTKEFELPENTVRVMIAGSFHGVSGNYYCTPAASSTCAAQVADDGFTLGGTADADNAFTAGGGAWTFKPTNPEDRLMDVPDNVYASYGWWLHKSENGNNYIASAFHDYRGTDAGTVGIGALRGTATYMGGAAGKYALRSSTGGTNDAGHFTADVELNAEFGEDHTISGTIDNFMGADGEARDWSVALSESTIADAGTIAGDPETAGNTDAQMTTWTMGGTAAEAAGQWSGDLREQGDDGVPAIATGTFYSAFGLDGKMVGAFGANKQ